MENITEKDKNIPDIVEDGKTVAQIQENMLAADLKKPKKDVTFIIILACIVFLVLICNLFFFQVAKVNGDSMSPTLEEKQFVIISKVASVNSIERGDIVVFDYQGKNLIKRVVALPGETIQIKTDGIYVNDELIEDYVDVEMNKIATNVFEEKVQLKDNEFVCIGDNRNNSFDCRRFGPITGDDIVGKVICRLIPFTTF